MFQLLIAYRVVDSSAIFYLLFPKNFSLFLME